jgi:hypothetical protein
MKTYQMFTSVSIFDQATNTGHTGLGRIWKYIFISIM